MYREVIPGRIIEEHWLNGLQEWEVAKTKQDKALDSIEKGITTLKGIGEAMGDELRHQNILVDEIESKVVTLLP